MLNVPSALVSKSYLGFSTEYGTEAFAPIWKTTSTSSMVFFNNSASLVSPFMNVILSLAFSKFSGFPVWRLSIAVTSKPSSTSRSTKWLPINPAPPVTRTFLPFMFILPTSFPVQLDDRSLAPITYTYAFPRHRELEGIADKYGLFSFTRFKALRSPGSS